MTEDEEETKVRGDGYKPRHDSLEAKRWTDIVCVEWRGCV